MDEAGRARLLLGVLYLSFISLGLPDSILGVAWPVMRETFAKPLEYAGLLMAMTTMLSVGASLLSGSLLRRWSTGLIIVVCAWMTAAAMFGYALSPVWSGVMLCTVLFGLGQGGVDTAVNAYMARHYSARQMNWVHCCWGIGATGGPLILTAAFGLGLSWRGGYAAIGSLQSLLAVIFVLSLSLWHSGAAGSPAVPVPRPDNSISLPAGTCRPRRLRAAAAGVLFYFMYPGVEMVTGLWAASYLVDVLGASTAQAGMGVALFWGALTCGRFCGGVVAVRLSSRALIRTGLAVAVLGIGLFLAGRGALTCRAALMLIGFGLGPLYPTMMHDTPFRVGPDYADRVVGFQVGAAMAGAAVLPGLVGLAIQRTSLHSLGFVLLGFAALVFAAHEVSLANARKRF